jgi:hypothetical protein
MSPVNPLNPSRSNAKVVSSTGSNTMQIPGDIVSPPYHHVHARKSSSLVMAHTKNDTKHTSPKRSSSAHQHATPVKSNTVYVFARPCVWLTPLAVMRRSSHPLAPIRCRSLATSYPHHTITSTHFPTPGPSGRLQPTSYGMICLPFCRLALNVPCSLGTKIYHPSLALNYW